MGADERARRVPHPLEVERLDQRDDRLLGHVADITHEGIMLVSEQPIPMGSQYQLQMVLPEVIFGKGKTDTQVADIAVRLLERAANMLAAASRTRAAIEGRDYVIPDDVKDLAAPGLRHRLVLSYEALAEGLTADALIGKVMAHIPVPDKPMQHTTP